VNFQEPVGVFCFLLPLGTFHFTAVRRAGVFYPGKVSGLKGCFRVPQSWGLWNEFLLSKLWCFFGSRFRYQGTSAPVELFHSRFDAAFP